MSFDEFTDVYEAIDSENKDQAITLLKLRDWYILLCDFDPISQAIAPMALSQVSQRIESNDALTSDSKLSDRFTQIIDWSFEAIIHVLKQPKEKILREHTMVAINRVKDIDNKTIEWLSRQTGRNIREKLIGKKSIKAISKRQSLDTLENRVFKALLLKMAEILFTKLETIGLTLKQEELLQKIQRWIISKEASEIKQLSHVTPNNILLQDKYYKKIWSSWLDLQYLDERTSHDATEQTNYFMTASFWRILTTLQAHPNISMLEQPCYFDYDKFKLKLPEVVECMYYPSEVSISFINIEKEFAFATTKKNERIFCHSSSFSPKTIFKNLKINDKISCNIIKTDKGLQAVDGS